MREDRSSIGTGIILITVGLLFMADRQGFLRFHQLWPLILIVIGVTMIAFPRDPMHISSGMRDDDGRWAARADRRQRGRMSGALWMILAGVLLLANQNHWLSLEQSWPLFIVAGGLSLVFGSLSRRPVPPSNGPVDPGPTSNDASRSGGQWQ